ncbi:DUF3099 domain-containing protein [Cryobacterium algoricola]|uniref:DUF3099 domain-containing protein n=1 Tax=Cryobacterium algoricola TaxID=1259183 RepID=A0ABY2IHZ3_9MICO|nr:DUF3099 domain-containing protein [Cryobacterium algoricola]TFB90296.1 DUF3099 domain-containing protein [Cryobacterium algoricola]
MKQQSITSLPPSPEDERRARMIRYSVTMGIRMVCIVLMLFVHGWWLLVCAAGAILLPYFAVIVANVHGSGAGTTVVRPGAVQLYRGQSSSQSSGQSSTGPDSSSFPQTSPEQAPERPDSTRDASRDPGADS